MFTVLHSAPDSAIELAWRDMLSRSCWPAHYSGPDIFSEPERSGRFAILAMSEANSEIPQVLGSLTGTMEGNRIVSGQGLSPLLCLDETQPQAPVVDSLIDGLLSLDRRIGLATVFSWKKITRFVERGFTERPDPGSAVIDIAAGAEQVFKTLGDRASIRAAIKAGVEVREATDDDVPEYHRIVAEWSKAKSLPCPTLDVYRAIFKLRKNRRLFLAFHDGTMLGGSVIRFLENGIVEYAANSSRPESLRLRPNDLLLWRAIEWSCVQGYKTFSLAGSHHFSRKFGGRLVPSYRYRLDRTFLRQHDRREQCAVKGYAIWKKLPEPLQERVKMARNFLKSSQ